MPNIGENITSGCYDTHGPVSILQDVEDVPGGGRTVRSRSSSSSSLPGGGKEDMFLIM